MVGGSNRSGHSRLGGIAPDGATQVSILMADGRTHTVSARSNVFMATGSTEMIQATVLRRDGSTVASRDLR